MVRALLFLGSAALLLSSCDGPSVFVKDCSHGRPTHVWLANGASWDGGAEVRLAEFELCADQCFRLNQFCAPVGGAPHGFSCYWDQLGYALHYWSSKKVSSVHLRIFDHQGGLEHEETQYVSGVQGMDTCADYRADFFVSYAIDTGEVPEAGSSDAPADASEDAGGDGADGSDH